MPSLREIRGHIQSVRSISKVTKAMEVVAAAKAHRLEARINDTQPFSVKSWEVLSHLAATVADQSEQDIIFCGHPRVEQSGIVLFTSNRGMVGAYDHTVFTTALRYLMRREARGEIITVGRTGRDMMLGQQQHIHADFSALDDGADIDAITPVSQVLLDGSREGHFQEVVLVYAQHRRGAHLQPTARQLLPISPETLEPREYIYEPDPEELLASLLSRIVRFQIYEAFLEARAAENTARMIAMHNATNNAGDLTESLSRGYNKARQEAVTGELTDTLGGAVSLERKD